MEFSEESTSSPHGMPNRSRRIPGTRAHARLPSDHTCKYRYGGEGVPVRVLHQGLNGKETGQAADLGVGGRELEADVGKTLNYTIMDTNEFTYRYNIYDRFVRNIFNYPHQKIIDTLGISG